MSVVQAMQLLFLSNFYPPASRGGYEQWCQEVAEDLRTRGHDVLVLTSRHGREGLATPDPPWVRRELYLEMELASLRNGIQFFAQRHAREQANLACLGRLLTSFQPDMLVIWGMWNLPWSLPALAEAWRPQQVAYYMGDYWPTLPNQLAVYWQEPARHWANVLPKRLLGAVARRMLAHESRPALAFTYAMFPTPFLRAELQRQGIAPKVSAIIAGAVDTAPYTAGVHPAHRPAAETFSLLSVGRLAAEKGIHTIIEALGRLVHQMGYKQLKLTVVGAGDAAYEAQLRTLIVQEKLQAYVTLRGAQPKAALPSFYAQADLFVFAALWPEPFGRVLVEAMAAGLAVVGTAVGGAGEILIENVTGLTFAPGDATGLATQIARLIESPTLRQRLSACGRQHAVEKFDLHRMTTEIEAFLQSLVEQA